MAFVLLMLTEARSDGKMGMGRHTFVNFTDENLSNMVCIQTLIIETDACQSW